MGLLFKKRKTQTVDFNIEDLPNEILQSAYKSYQLLVENKGSALIEFFTEFFDENICGYSLMTHYNEATEKFNYISVGTNLIMLFGKDTTGSSVDQVYNKKTSSDALEFYNDLAEFKKPLLSTNTWKTLKRTIGYHTLGLPFVDIFDNYTVFIVFITPNDLDIRSRRDWREADDVKHLQKMDVFVANMSEKEG